MTTIGDSHLTAVQEVLKAAKARGRGYCSVHKSKLSEAELSQMFSRPDMIEGTVDEEGYVTFTYRPVGTSWYEDTEYNVSIPFDYLRGTTDEFVATLNEDARKKEEKRQAVLAQQAEKSRVLEEKRAREAEARRRVADEAAWRRHEERRKNPS